MVPKETLRRNKVAGVLDYEYMTVMLYKHR